jgi:hypothetical protein
MISSDRISFCDLALLRVLTSWNQENTLLAIDGRDEHKIEFGLQWQTSAILTTESSVGFGCAPMLSNRRKHNPIKPSWYAARFPGGASVTVDSLTEMERLSSNRNWITKHRGSFPTSSSATGW